MISKTTRSITKELFEEFKELYLSAQLGEEGMEARGQFYALESQVAEMDNKLSELKDKIKLNMDAPDNARALSRALDAHHDALRKCIAFPIAHYTRQDAGAEGIESPDAKESAQLIVDFLKDSESDTQTQNIQRELQNAGIAILNAINGTSNEGDKRTLDVESWTQVMDKFYEYDLMLDQFEAYKNSFLQLREERDQQESRVEEYMPARESRSKNPQDDLSEEKKQDLQTRGLLDDYNTFRPLIASLIDKYGFDRVAFHMFEERYNLAIAQERARNRAAQELPFPPDDEWLVENEQGMTEGKHVAPSTRGRINALKELFPEVSESSMSKAGMANSAGALIGFALLIASIVAGRTPSVAQTPILSQNPFILTALVPAILGAITLALIVAAIARMRTNKDITLEFSLGHIAQEDAMLLHGHGIRNRADDLPPEECNRISQQTSSALLQSIKSTLRRQIQDIGEGTIDIEKAVARPNHDPRIKVLSLIYSDSEYAESAHNSENKLVITLRAGSMAEKKAWLGVIARCTPSQSHPESLHDVQHHYSETEPSFPIGHNGPLALIAKTMKVTISTTKNAGDVLLDSVKTALNNCQQALIDASKKEPSSIMSEHSISSPTASEQHRSN